MKPKYDAISQFLFEAGMLKNVPRSGWSTINAPEESVAEHVYRTVVVGHVLAKEARLDKEEELLLLKSCLFHDLHEARIGDLHKIAKRYVVANEREAEKEQLENLPPQMRREIEMCLHGAGKKIENLAHDADKLECAITAKEYLDRGYKVGMWIENTKKMLKTTEGKRLLEKIEKCDSIEWIAECKKKICLQK